MSSSIFWSSKVTRSAKRWNKPGWVIALALAGLLSSFQAHGQQERFLRGEVVEGDQGVSDVHVLNLSAQTATITNETGQFRINAETGDTLLFSAVRYRRQTLVVREAMFEVAAIRVPLEPFVNELEEVVVTPYDLTGDLTKDLERLPEKEVVTSWSLGLPNANARKWTPTENRLNEATTGGGIVPLNPILNAITGRTRRLKKQLAYERRYDQARRIRLQVTDSVIVQDLGIPPPRIEDFMYFCEVDSLFEEVAASEDQLKIWAFLRRKSEEYKGYNPTEE